MPQHGYGVSDGKEISAAVYLYNERIKTHVTFKNFITLSDRRQEKSLFTNGTQK
jgi:hypothetical protein